MITACVYSLITVFIRFEHLQVGEHSSVDEVRAVLASVQMARESERLQHLKELTKVHALHSRIAVELAESRAIDKHQHSMEMRAEEIQDLLYKTKEVQEVRHTRRRASRQPAWAGTPPTKLKSVDPSPVASPKHSPQVKRKAAAAEVKPKKKQGKKMGKSAKDVAKSKARTDLILFGLKPTPKSPRTIGGVSSSPPPPDAIALGNVLRKSPIFDLTHWDDYPEPLGHSDPLGHTDPLYPDPLDAGVPFDYASLNLEGEIADGVAVGS